jgi:CBS domain-containing protein
LRGEHRSRIDLKAHGTAPIVDLARLFALSAGRPETATVARLRAAADQGTAGKIAIDPAPRSTTCSSSASATRPHA